MGLFSRRKAKVAESINMENALLVRPGYEEIVSDTRTALAMYYGGAALLDMIEAFSTKEDAEKLRWRKMTAIENYENYPEEISQQYIESIKKAGKIDRKFTDDQKPENEYLETEYREWFDKEFSPQSLILPEIFVHICLPEVTKEKKGSILSKADARAEGIRPYQVIIFPNNIQNFVLGDDGLIEQITLRVTDNLFQVYDAQNLYEVELTREPGKAGTPEKTTAAIKTTTAHGFSRCPFVRAIWRENKYVGGEPKPGQAMMHSITKRSKGALTLMSMLAESIHFHLFPKEAMGEATAQNVMEQGQAADKVTIVGKDKTGQTEPFPAYIQTDTKPIEVLERINYERIPKIIYHRARLRDRYTEKVQSGIAKAFDMVPEVGVLGEIADFWMKADMQIVTLLAEGFQLEIDKPIINYPKTFNVKSLAEILQEVAELMRVLNDSGLPQSMTANRITVKRMYKQMYPDLTVDEYKLIDDEIEAWVAPAPAPVKSLPPVLPEKLSPAEELVV